MEFSLNLLICSLTSRGIDDAEPAQMQIKIIPTSPRLMGNFDIFICSSWIKELRILLLISADLDIILGCGITEGKSVPVANLDLVYIDLDTAVLAVMAL